jgi:hypothetical protein
MAQPLPRRRRRRRGIGAAAHGAAAAGAGSGRGCSRQAGDFLCSTSNHCCTWDSPLFCMLWESALSSSLSISVCAMRWLCVSERSGPHAHGAGGGPAAACVAGWVGAGSEWPLRANCTLALCSRSTNKEADHAGRGCRGEGFQSLSGIGVIDQVRRPSSLVEHLTRSAEWSQRGSTGLGVLSRQTQACLGRCKCGFGLGSWGKQSSCPKTWSVW